MLRMFRDALWTLKLRFDSFKVEKMLNSEFVLFASLVSSLPVKCQGTRNYLVLRPITVSGEVPVHVHALPVGKNWQPGSNSRDQQQPHTCPPTLQPSLEKWLTVNQPQAVGNWALSILL
ncbi:uncharacterized protein PADG_12039 [Paracoccidioides brasiliensis Pb18]|uniref:Uncharacterized protein n=1 Tax=Paracoccidioides brasiliensis (strain Pb18) TaxID=502780 RepID=A0A0A0HTB5_PARBD|nr:uncharacterized protein PADG_12039 [Paracoccidioides brasiliensis Pb18]KGM91897.1 hypothetical protein PADG_12039 [Paracoccidioides brasiliensis Pb18]ODH51258.1 hypothetical protein GX48_02687 [Paracoccidioides brasiliensis]